MVAKDKNQSRVATIRNELGLHARSAAQIAEIARNSKADVWIMNGGQKADASSIMDILTLECAQGTKITIVIEDGADSDILETIFNLVDSGFGE